jgi:hypothetical protein
MLRSVAPEREFEFEFALQLVSNKKENHGNITKNPNPIYRKTHH